MRKHFSWVRARVSRVRSVFVKRMKFFETKHVGTFNANEQDNPSVSAIFKACMYNIQAFLFAEMPFNRTFARKEILSLRGCIFLSSVLGRCFVILRYEVPKNPAFYRFDKVGNELTQTPSKEICLELLAVF